MALTFTMNESQLPNVDQWNIALGRLTVITPCCHVEVAVINAHLL